MLHLDDTSVIINIIKLIGMDLVPKHVTTTCQNKGDKDDTVLAVNLIIKRVSAARQGGVLQL